MRVCTVLFFTIFSAPVSFLAQAAEDSSSAEYSFLRERSAYEKVYSNLVISDRLTAGEIERRKRLNQPIIIFIPGILGSEISKSKCGIMWGKAGSHCSLAYSKEEKDLVQTKPLDSYDAFVKNVDIYGSFFRTIDNFNVTDIKHLLLFSYDWRQDNRRSAKDLDDKMLSEPWISTIKDRKIIIVAHSMGGLVTTYWYNYFYKDNPDRYSFKSIEKVVYLGTPHLGATSMLVTMIEGYSSSHTDGWLYKGLQNALHLFGDLASSGHTFPSTYQLLPTDNKVVSLYERGSFRDYPDVFSIATWKKFDWLSRVRGDRSVDEFYDSITPLLKNGLRFHEELAKFDIVPNSIYFYGNNHPTPTSIRVNDAGDSYKTDTNVNGELRNGDGRVPIEIAKNLKQPLFADSKKRPPPSPEQLRQLGESHGDLAKGEGVIYYIKDILDYARSIAETEIAELVRGNVSLQHTFAKEKVLLHSVSKNLPPDFLSGPINQANSLILIKAVQLSGINYTPNKIAYYAASKARTDADKAALYGLSFALTDVSSSTHRYYAALNLGYHLTKLNLFDDAKKFTILAADLALNNPAIDKMDQAKLYNTLGVIEWAKGNKNEAFDAWKKSSADFGYAVGTKNLQTHF